MTGNMLKLNLKNGEIQEHLL